MADQEVKSKQKIEIGSAFSLLGKSWELVSKNLKLFFLLFLPYLLLSIPNSSPFANKNYEKNNKDPNPFKEMESGEILVMVLIISSIALAIMLIATFFISAYYQASVRIASGKSITLREAYSFAKKSTFRQFGLSIVSGFIILIGLLLLIVPGIIAIGRLAMAPYLLADKDLSIKEALVQSNEMGKKYFGYVWGAIGVWILVQILVTGPAIIPIIGGVLGALLLIPFNLVLALRYVQLRDLKV